MSSPSPPHTHHSYFLGPITIGNSRFPSAPLFSPPCLSPPPPLLLPWEELFLGLLPGMFYLGLVTMKEMSPKQ